MYEHWPVFIFDITLHGCYNFGVKAICSNSLTSYGVTAIKWPLCCVETCHVESCRASVSSTVMSLTSSEVSSTTCYKYI